MDTMREIASRGGITIWAVESAESPRISIDLEDEATVIPPKLAAATAWLMLRMARLIMILRPHQIDRNRGPFALLLDLAAENEASRADLASEKPVIPATEPQVREP